MAGALRLLQRDPPLLSRPVAPSAHRRPARPTRPAAARPRSEWQQPRAATNEGSTLKDPQARQGRRHRQGCRAWAPGARFRLSVCGRWLWRLVSDGGLAPGDGPPREGACACRPSRPPTGKAAVFSSAGSCACACLRVRAGEPAWHALPLPPRPAGTRPLQPRPGASACLRGRRRCGSARGGGDLRRCSAAWRAFALHGG